MADGSRNRRTGDPGPAVPGLQVLGRIGRGASAEVYRVRRGASEYALKLFRTEGNDRQTIDVAFRREAALLACIDHPGLPHVYEVGLTGDGPYLLMELVEGDRLTDAIVRRPLAEDRLIAVGIDLADALGAAHDADLVHRDVKPDNIVLGSDGTARLVDFGLATRASRDRTGVAAGTLAYAAPEQSGMLNRRVDGRADLYSLGAVLFEAATGSPPFVAADVGELVRMHAVVAAPDPRDLRPGLSPAFAAIIGRLLAKDPDDRYRHAAGLKADLRRLADEPGTDFPLGTADAPSGIDRDLPMAGRRAEVEQLLDRWARANDGAGGCAVIEGLSGVGKSRLAREVVAAAGQKGCPVLHGKAAADHLLPLATIRAAIDGHLRFLEQAPEPERRDAHRRLVEAAAAMAPLVASLSPELATVLGVAAAGTEVALDQFTDAVATFLAEYARSTGGAVLYLDDVQWLDDVTCAVLRQLAPKLTGTPLLVLATARDDADSRPGLDAFRAATTAALDTAVTLRPLDEVEVSALVSAATGGTKIDGKAAARLTAQCNGNPFTLLERVNAIVDAGLACPHWGTWQVDYAGLALLDLPTDAAALVLKRLDALDQDERRLLSVAAIIGPQFAPDLVAEACGVDRQRVLALVTGASWRRLVASTGDGDCAFLHDRIREALVAQFTPDALRAAHELVAGALARQDRQDPASVYALADHCLRGELERNPERVFQAATAAGRLALADHAPAQAVSYLERAAAAAAGQPTDLAWLRTLGAAYHRSGRFADAVTTLRRALAGTTDRLERAKLLHQVAEVHDSTWNMTEQEAAINEALAELGRPLPTSQVRVALTTSWMFLVGLLIGRTRIGYGTARGTKAETYRVMMTLSRLYSWRLVRDMQAHRIALVGLRELYFANRLGRCAENASANGERALLARLLGLHSIADKLDANGSRMARDLGDPRVSAYLAWVRGVAMFGSGADSGESTRQAMLEHGQWMDPGHHLDCYAMLAWDLAMHGDTTALQTWFERRHARVAASGQFGHVAVLPVEAALPALRGQAAEAADMLTRLRAVPGLPLVMRVDLLAATMQSAVEQRELGAVFDDAVQEFAGLGLSPLGMLPALHSVFVYQAYGRLAQLRAAAGEERAARLDAARDALAQLGKVTRRPLLAAHHAVLTAALHEVVGEPKAALAALATAEPTLLAVDAPLAAFEAALVRARALRTLDIAGEAGRQAQAALGIAERYGWAHRARWVRTEFQPDRSRRSGAMPHTDDMVAPGVYRRRLAALEQVSLASSRVLDPDRLARIALDETIRILGAERALLFLAEGDEARLSPRLGRDAAGAELAELTGYSASLVDQVRQSHEAIVVAGTEEGEALGSQSALIHGLRSIIIAPLCLEDRLLGVVYLDSRVAKGIFTIDDVDILTAITTQVAVALETARAAQLELAVTTVARQRDLAETLRAAMNEVSGSLDPETVLHRLVAASQRLVGGHRGWLVTTEVLIADVRLAALAALAVPLTGGPGDGWPAAVAEPVGDLSSWLAVPLTVRGDPLGVLVLATEQADAYGPAQIETVDAMATQGMVAYENARLFSQVRELAATDGLTLLATRRHFLEVANREITAAGRHCRPLAAIMIDIDHFKRVNDTWGHPAGDDVIRAVAACLRLHSRDIDVAGRYGGEEFVMVLPDVGDRAQTIAERLRAEVEATLIDTAVSKINVTISVGVAYLRVTDTDAATLLARTDECLYRAKRGGRNRVVVFEDEWSTTAAEAASGDRSPLRQPENGW